MELVGDLEMQGRATSPVNPVPFVQGLPESPPRLDHLLVTAEEVGDSTKFFEDIFDPDNRIPRRPGTSSATWLTVTDSPHDLAIVTGKNVDCTTSPGGWTTGTTFAARPTSSPTTAFRWTSGLRVMESRAATPSTSSTRCTRTVFTGGYRPDLEFPTITWTEDQVGRAFYYEGDLNTRFMTVHT